MKSKPSAKQLSEIVEHENEHWSKIFNYEKKNFKKDLYSSYWWEDYFKSITKIIRSRVGEGSTVLELGSGSGKASLLLGNEYKKHLFDISPLALSFARLLAKRLSTKHVTYTEGNGFDTKLPKKSYDLVWNIGVVEHYSKAQATTFVSEMMRLTKKDGYIAVAVPNFKSFHIWKARMLNNPLFKFIPGYRLDSEHSYTSQDLENFIKKSSKESSRSIVSMEMFRVGNPLPMGSPKFLILTLGYVANIVFKRNRFLLIAVARIK